MTNFLASLPPASSSGWRDKFSSLRQRFPLGIALELGLIFTWTLFVGRHYLDLSSEVVPHGREFGMAIHPHFIWSNFKECGLCVMWNGFYNGGFPAFTEIHAGVLHPLVIVATLIWGGLNGAKIVLVGSLAMAGVAQWWQARVLRLGWVARMWSAALAVAGGHLASRMEIGVVGVVLSTAACSLVIPAALKLARDNRQRDVVWLALMLALAFLSGQGYLQLGLVFAIMPAFILFFFNDRMQLTPVWRKFAQAVGIALLLSAVFLVPFSHFWPQFGKDIDPSFSSAQPLQFVPLNFVVNDVDLYYSELLNKQPYPYLYMNYIGWIPVLLALVPLRLAKKKDRRLLTFFGIAIGLILLASSAVTFKELQRIMPEFAASIRNPSLIAGLAVPLILGLAAWGVDQLLKLERPFLTFSFSDKNNGSKFRVRLSWVIMAGLLLISLRASYIFSQNWLFTTPVEDYAVDVVTAVETENAQWAALPFGEHFWSPLAAEAGIKLTEHVRPSHWRNRARPPAYLVATREGVDPELPNYVGVISGINIYRQPDAAYAYVLTDSGERVPCAAQAQGGHINVQCDNSQPGRLVVRENIWSGWRAWIDGQRTAFSRSEWLTVFAPAGEHTYRFRYRPWDVPLGLLFSLTGVVLCIAFWLGETAVSSPPESDPDEQNEADPTTPDTDTDAYTPPPTEN